ncbi:MAG: hypothetical protein WEE20_12470 [Bacteroidota bacterium]
MNREEAAEIKEAILEKGVSEGVLLKLRAQLILLQNALVNVDRKGFGVCTRCSEEIPCERLLAMP